MPEPTRLHRLIPALLLLAAAASAQPLRPAGVPLDSLAVSFAEAHGLPSLVVGVVVDGHRYVVGAGDVNGRPPDAHTIYEIGSVTKVVTSLLLADAVSRGETTLETPLTDLLGAPVGAHPGGPIRLVDLATHASGLPRLDEAMFEQDGYDPADPYARYTLEHLLAFLAEAEPATEPGQASGYSNAAVGALGYALARRATRSWEDLAHARILAPLGLTETMAAVPDSLAARIATGHGEAGEPVAHWTFQDPTIGAGGLRSTAADMLTFAEAAIHPEETPLDAAFALTLQPRRAVAERLHQGLAWQLVDLNGGGTMAFHDGGTGGFRSFFAALPDDDLGIIVLTNRSVDVTALAFDVLGRLRTARAGLGG